ncbi:MAG: hypothetical protein M3O70_03720 [Actinomycetota bacterium]|nr:hypothetical protein [Actinomycetota bacterium]
MEKRNDGGLTPPLQDNERTPRANLTHSPLRLSIVAGVLVATVVLGVGVFILVWQGARWSASASVVVLPVKDLDPEIQAGYYETLSRGQVVATFAEMLRLHRFETAAAEKLRLSPEQRKQVKVTVEVVPDTAIIMVTSRATDPTIAEEMVDHVLDAWDLEVWHLSTPYVPSVLSWASGTARRSGTEPLQLGAALVVVALISGLAVQQGTLQAAALLAHRRDEDEVEPTAPPPPAVSETPAGELDELEAALFERWWKPGLLGSTPGDAGRRSAPAEQVSEVDDESSWSPQPESRDALEAAPDTRTR